MQQHNCCYDYVQDDSIAARMCQTTESDSQAKPQQASHARASKFGCLQHCLWLLECGVCVTFAAAEPPPAALPGKMVISTPVECRNMDTWWATNREQMGGCQQISFTKVIALCSAACMHFLHQ
jgi:hypothetical protein